MAPGSKSGPISGEQSDHPVLRHSDAANSSNTGVQTAEALIDWLSVTAPIELTVDQVLAIFGGPNGFRRLPYGKRVYRSGLVREHVKVFYAGRPDMGVHVELCGQACRQLEDEGLLLDVAQFLRSLVGRGFSVSSIHVALDDRSRLLSLDQMRTCLREGLVVSRFHSYGLYENGRLRDGKVLGGSLYFGSSKSATQIVVYDKGAMLESPHPWTRVELRLRNRNASAAVRRMIDGGVGIAAALVRSSIDFKVPGTQSQRDRWPSQPWWEKFLGHCGKMPLSVPRRETNHARTREWLLRSVAKPLARVVFEEGLDFQERLLNVGAQRMARK